MSDLNRYAIVLEAVRSLNAAASWTGKTHVITTLYIVSTKVRLPFEFVLYKHGPYSFDTNDAIESMSAVGLLSLTATPPYGVQLRPGRFERVLDATILNAVDSAVKLIGKSKVQDLEAIATSVWVISHCGEERAEEIAKKVAELKPHLGEQLIRAAVSKAEKWHSN